MHTVTKSFTFPDNDFDVWNVDFLFTSDAGEVAFTTIKKDLPFEKAVALCSRLNGGDGLTFEQRVALAQIKPSIDGCLHEKAGEEVKEDSKKWAKVLDPDIPF